jgi:hypothetical protein
MWLAHHVAVRALAFKWIRILFACWKNRVHYDPDRYLKALQNRGYEYAQIAPLICTSQPVNKTVNIL